MTAIFLDDDERHFFDQFIRRETAAALLAFASATDGLAVIGSPRIRYFCICTLAKWASHVFSSYLLLDGIFKKKRVRRDPLFSC